MRRLIRDELTSLIELYRGAQRLQADAFAVHAFSWLTARLYARPMVATRQDADAPEIAGPRFAPLREHLRRFKARVGGAWGMEAPGRSPCVPDLATCQ